MGRREGDEFRLFVGGLGQEITSADLHSHFESCGNVLNVRKPSGADYAFIVYEDSASAEKAISELHKSHLKGSQISIAWSRNRLKIMDKPSRGKAGSVDSESEDDGEIYESVSVGNLNYSARRGDLLDFGKRIGPVKDCDVIFKGRRSTGTGFITFEKAEDAKRAVKVLDGGTILGKRVTIEPRTLETADQSTDSDIFTIYIGNIPLSVSEQTLRQVYSKYGNIMRCEVIPTRGYGFLEFVDAKDGHALLAEKPVIIIDGKQLSLQPSKTGPPRSRNGSRRPSHDNLDDKRVVESTREYRYRRSRSPPPRVVRSRDRSRSPRRRSRSRSRSPPRREFYPKAQEEPIQRHTEVSAPQMAQMNPAATASNMLMNPLYSQMLMMQQLMQSMPNMATVNATPGMNNMAMNPQMLAALQQQQLQLQQMLLAQQQQLQQQTMSRPAMIPPFSGTGQQTMSPVLPPAYQKSPEQSPPPNFPFP